MNLKLLLALSLSLFAMNVWAEHVGNSSSSSNESPTTQATLPIGFPDLRGTGWEGTFTQLGITNNMRVGFLNDLTETGKIPYFQNVMKKKNVSSRALADVDAPCDFTPRLASFFPGDPITGEITVYKCVEASDGKQFSDERIKLKAKVTKFAFTEGGKAFHMEALIPILKKGVVVEVPVSYDLKKKTLPSQVRAARLDKDRTAMHDWVLNK